RNWNLPPSPAPRSYSTNVAGPSFEFRFSSFEFESGAHMQRHIGVLAAEHLAVGLVEGAKVVGLLRIYPSESTQAQIQVMPVEDMAAGIAATRGQLDKLVRVWTLGNGIGFGRYPWAEGAWEGGHTIVTLDPKEKFCGCGGVGHLEGIMGHRAMRRRFLDLEPEEIFDNARRGDSRCAQFVTRWHRALAAATATSIHLEGPGKFFVTGPNARFIDPK